MTRPDAFCAASVAALSLALLAGPAAAQSRVFHVDYQNGNDAADGRTPQTAWKHAPGDSRSATAARLVLQPGDIVRFRPGVRYRGTFSPRAAGTAEQPVILDGGGSGGIPAIIDGSDPLANVRRCQSAAECLGSPHWRSLWRADLPATARFDDWLFVDDNPLQIAQYPALAANDSDDPAKLVAIPRAELGRLQAGAIAQKLPAGLDRGGPVLMLWVQPNVFAYNSAVRVSESGVTFDLSAFVNGSFRPYTDRDNRFALINVPLMVNRPGTFALAPEQGLALFWPRTATTAPRVSIGGRRVGLKLPRASHLVVRGFAFRNFGGRHATEQAPAAITNHGSLPGISITGNSFHGFAAAVSPYAAIHTSGSRGLLVSNNRFTAMPFASALVVDNTVGAASVRCNSFADLGRTGIRFNNVANGEIRGNHLTRINGVHGNAITAYNDSRNVVIAQNVVTDSTRPLTVHGAGTPYFDASAGVPSVTVRDNVLISNDPDGGGLTSYGRTPNFVVENNFLAAPRFALKLAGTETGFSATGNRLVGDVSVGNRTPMFNAGANQIHDAEGNGVQLVSDMSRTPVPAAACRG